MHSSATLVHVSPVLLLVASDARAEEAPARPRPPVAVAARGMTIGELNGFVGLEPALVHTPDADAVATAVPLRLGITPALEVFASPVAQSVDPVVRDPALGAIVRFNKDPVQVGARVSTDLALFGAAKTVALQAGIPVRIRAGDGLLAIDTGAHALVPVVPDVALGALLPVAAQLNPTPNVFVTAGSGLKIGDLSAAGDTFAVPLTATAGGSVPHDAHAFLDLGVRAGFGDARATASWSLGLFARLFFFP